MFKPCVTQLNLHIEQHNVRESNVIPEREKHNWRGEKHNKDKRKQTEMTTENNQKLKLSKILKKQTTPNRQKKKTTTTTTTTTTATNKKQKQKNESKTTDRE